MYRLGAGRLPWRFLVDDFTGALLFALVPLPAIFFAGAADFLGALVGTCFLEMVVFFAGGVFFGALEDTVFFGLGVCAPV